MLHLPVKNIDATANTETYALHRKWLKESIS